VQNWSASLVLKTLEDGWYPSFSFAGGEQDIREEFVDKRLNISESRGFVITEIGDKKYIALISLGATVILRDVNVSSSDGTTYDARGSISTSKWGDWTRGDQPHAVIVVLDRNTEELIDVFAGMGQAGYEIGRVGEYEQRRLPEFSFGFVRKSSDATIETDRLSRLIDYRDHDYRDRDYRDRDHDYRDRDRDRDYRD
jgi:hypothetical protein